METQIEKLNKRKSTLFYFKVLDENCMKLEGSTEADQETSTPAQGRNQGPDEFQIEVNRMRNSLNALTLKHFMFESASNALVKPDESVVEEKELQESEEILFKRSLSKHRKDKSRTHSKHINTNDIIAALSTSQEEITELRYDEKPTIVGVKHHRPLEDSAVEFENNEKAFDVENFQVKTYAPQKIKPYVAVKEPFIEINYDKHVRFVEEKKAKPKLIFKEASRDSDEVAVINHELPWQKKHEYRTVTPYFKAPVKAKAASHENIAFRPIETSRSTEDVNKEVLKPVPIFASKSYQELPTSWEYKPFDRFKTKSSDDLLLDNIDGHRKPESKRHKLMRIRSTSNNSLNRLSDQAVYENFHYDIKEEPAAAESVMRRKPPLAQPRHLDEASKRDSKTLVYVLDKCRDEFVLETPENEEDFYDDVLLRNNVDRHSDSALFDSLFESREDCKLGLGL